MKNGYMMALQPAQAGGVTKLYLYDDITADPHLDLTTWTYEDSETSAEFFRDRLQEIPPDSEIELHINSNGGSVKEGVAIYNLLKQSGRKLTGIVDGVAHSVAFLILQACDRRIMMLGTTALVHNMWAVVSGNAHMLRKAADDLDDMMESNRKIFLARATITEEELTAMMDAETYLTPDRALEYGLIDEVDTGATAAADPAQLMQQMQALRQQLASTQSFRQQLQALAQAARDHMVTDSPVPEAEQAAAAEPTGPVNEFNPNAAETPREDSNMSRFMHLFADIR